VWLRNAGRFVVVMCACVGLALGASGCVSDDTAIPVTPGIDAAIDSAFSASDASGTVDGAPADAATDAPEVDSSAPDAAPVDAGNDATAMSQIGLVAGGAVGHSPSYTMTVTAGPATAPLLKSPHYQLAGGMSATTQKP
jgi:hypothetical protein